MKRLLTLCTALALVSVAGAARSEEAYPLAMPDMPLHDPFIVADKAAGTYYLYTSNVPGMTGKCVTGTMVYKSRDLKAWSNPDLVFELPGNIWANGGAWAPEVHRWNGKYVLFTTLHNEALPITSPAPKPNRKPYRRGTVAAVADSPEGPFTVINSGEPVAPARLMTLDGTLYVDSGGKPWFVYAHEWVQETVGTIEALPLDDNLKAIGEPRVLFKASDAPWAAGQKPFSPEDVVYVTDGPQFFRSSDGSLLMLWSSWGSDGYVQSVARSASGELFGPWTQSDEPLIRKDSGHGMLFDSFDGKLMLVLHRPFKNARGKLYEVRDAGGRLEIVADRTDLDGDTGAPPGTPPRARCP